MWVLVKRSKSTVERTRSAPESATAVGHHRSTDVHRTSTPIEESTKAKGGLRKSYREVITFDNEN